MATADNDNERLVLKFFATLSAGDFDGLKSMLRADSTWTVVAQSIPGAGDHVGPKGIVDEFLMPVRLEIFELGDPKVVVDTLLSKGSLVAAESRGLGRLKNGKEYRNSYAWLIEIKEGKIFKVREHMDSHYVTTLV
jgi:uncharacterized protein